LSALHGNRILAASVTTRYSGQREMKKREKSNENRKKSIFEKKFCWKFQKGDQKFNDMQIFSGCIFMFVNT
jgi:hypothetical protein